MPVGAGAAASAIFFSGAGAAAATATATAVATVAITTAISTAVSIGASFAFNALQSTPEVEIGKIEDTQVFSAEEGSSIFRCYGQKCRTGGTVLWVGPLLEQKKVHHEQGAKITEFFYFRDIAVAACHGPIEKITRVYANGIPIFETAENLEKFSNLFQVETYSSIPGFGFNDLMRIHSPLGVGPDLEDFTVGALLSVSFFDDFVNNTGSIPIIIPLIILGTGQDTTSEYVLQYMPGGSTWVDIGNFAAQQTTAPNSIEVRLSQQTTIFGQQYAQKINKHIGTQDQEVDFDFALPRIPIPPLPGLGEGGTIGAAGDKALPYRGIAYVFIKFLMLEDFGFQVPKIEFEILEKSERSVGSAIGDMLEIGGLASTDYVIDEALNQIELRGYVIPGPTPMNKAIAPLLRAFNIVVQETNEGKLRFMKRDAGVVHTIIESDLAAHEIGEAVPRPLQVDEISDDTLPEQVNIRYVDTGSGLQVGSQRERRINLTNRNTMKLDIPISMSPGQARNIAARELWASIINRQTVHVRLPPSYLKIKENDILLITADSNDYRIVCTKVERGNNFIIDVEGFIESEETLDFDITGEGSIDPPIVIGPPTLLVVVIDKSAPFSNANIGTFGVYLAVVNISTAPFHKCNIFVSVGEAPDTTPITGNLLFLTEITTESDWGQAKDTPSSTVRHGAWDTETSVTIEMKKGTLSSATEDEIYQGQNWAMLGDEVIAYTTATLITDTTKYKLTNLLRGLRDTADEITTHVVNEKFIPLRGDNYNFVPLSGEVVGQELYFGANPLNQSDRSETIFADPLTYFGHSARPFRVGNLEIEEILGGPSLWVTWSHRSTRHFATISELLDPPPFLPPGELYTIKVKNSGGTVLRALTKSVPYWMYSEAEQTADGASGTITIEVFEVSENGLSLVHSGDFAI